MTADIGAIIAHVVMPRISVSRASGLGNSTGRRLNAFSFFRLLRPSDAWADLSRFESQHAGGICSSSRICSCRCSLGGRLQRGRGLTTTWRSFHSVAELGPTAYDVLAIRGVARSASSACGILADFVCTWSYLLWLKSSPLPLESPSSHSNFGPRWSACCHTSGSRFSCLVPSRCPICAPWRQGRYALRELRARPMFEGVGSVAMAAASKTVGSLSWRRPS